MGEGDKTKWELGRENYFVRSGCTGKEIEQAKVRGEQIEEIIREMDIWWQREEDGRRRDLGNYCGRYKDIRGDTGLY